MKEELEKMTLPDLQEKLAEKEDALKALYKVKSEEITDEQLDEIEEIKSEVTEIKAAIAGKQKRERFAKERVAASVAGGAGSTDLSAEDKEISQMAYKFRFTEAIDNLKKRKEIDGVAKELHEEAVHENKEIQGNMAIPEKFVRILRKGESLLADGRVVNKDLTIATEGTDVRPLDLMGPIPILAPNPIVAQMGATVLNGATGNIQMSRHNGAATLAWEGETDAGAETTATFDKVTLTPNRLGGYHDISQVFIRQAHFDGEMFVRQELNRALAQALDTAAINGSGSGSEPTGLLGLSIGASDVGTNGGAPTWAVIKGNYKNVEDANAMGRNYAALTSPVVKYKLMETPKQASGVEGNFIINPGAANQAIPNLLGYPVYSSTLVPKDLTKGSGTNLSAYIVGFWEELIIAQWGGIDLLIDPFTQATSGLLRVVINGYFDVNVKHAASFSASDDLSY